MPGWKALAITAPTPATRRPGLFQQADAAEGRLAVGEEIVDEQYAVAGVDELRFERELVAGVFGEGKDLRLDDALLQDAGLGLFEDDHGHIQRLRGHHCRGDARSLDGGHAGDALARKQAGELRAHFAHQVHIHLMVQKGIHQQNILREGAPVAQYPFLQKLHPYPDLSRVFPFILPHPRAFFKARDEKTPALRDGRAGVQRHFYRTGQTPLAHSEPPMSSSVSSCSYLEISEGLKGRIFWQRASYSSSVMAS